MDSGVHQEGPLRCVLVPCQRGKHCDWHKPLDFFPQGCPIGAPPAIFAKPSNQKALLTCIPGSKGGLAVRVGQILFAFIAFMIILKINGYHSITAFRYFVTAMIFQCMWSAALMLVDVYALLTETCLHYCCLVHLFAVGDWITSMMTFSAACALAGITTLIDDDLNQCNPNHCTRYEGAAAMGFCAWFLITISFFYSFRLQAQRYI